MSLTVIAANVSICVRAGLPKPRGVPDTERNKDTKTLDYASTPLDANTLLWGRGRYTVLFDLSRLSIMSYNSSKSMFNVELDMEVGVPYILYV
jgi:hypothetical protein